MNEFMIMEKEFDIDMMKAQSVFENAFNKEYIALFEADDFMEGVSDKVGVFFTKAGKLIEDIIEAVKKFLKAARDKVKTTIETIQFKAKVKKVEEAIKVSPELGRAKVDYTDPKVRVATFNEMLKEITGLAVRLKRATTQDEIDSVEEALSALADGYIEKLGNDEADKVSVEAYRALTKLNSEIEMSAQLLEQVENNAEKALKALKEAQAKEAADKKAAEREAWKKLPLYKRMAITISNGSKKVGTFCSKHPIVTLAAVASVFAAGGLKHASNNYDRKRDMDDNHENVTKIWDAYNDNKISEKQRGELLQKEANRQAKERQKAADAVTKEQKKNEKEMKKNLKDAKK